MDEKKFNYDVVFFGGLYPKEIEDDVLKNSCGVVDNAANALQWNLVNGFDENLLSRLKIINSMVLGSFPKRYKKIKIKDFFFSHIDGAKDINVGYINITGYKHYSRIKTVLPHLCLWASESNGAKKVLIVYSMNFVNMYIIAFIKKKYPDIVILLVVTDLPEYMNTGNNVSILYKILKSVAMGYMDKKKLKVDGYVFLTKHMLYKLEIKERKWVVVEGIVNSKAIGHKKKYEGRLNNIINVVYTGTLNEKYGIRNLVDAFKLIEKENYRLIICGAGDSEDYVKNACQNDSRIIYHGQIKREDVLKVQKDSTVLVNPRQNNEIFTKYSFPSKTMEYLSTGKPLVAYKLEGIPDEYDEYIYYVEDEKIESLRNKIVEVAETNKNILLKKGQDTISWIYKEKNEVVQTKKILELVS
jgi:glycosyltransferase involved in cell wall biosynthesis